MICDIIIGAVFGAEGINEKMSLPCQMEVEAEEMRRARFPLRGVVGEGKALRAWGKFWSY